jgi:hypothetical protein|eukprot:COSAG01_NODE_1859_length_9042_cov_9.585374_3_plen_702_part_00
MPRATVLDRLTSAAPGFFAPGYACDNQGEDNMLLDGGMYAGGINPVNIAVQEAQEIWPGRPIGCIVSVGCGRGNGRESQSLFDLNSLAADYIKSASSHVSESEHWKLLEALRLPKSSSGGVSMSPLNPDVFGGVLYRRINPQLRHTATKAAGVVTTAKTGMAEDCSSSYVDGMFDETGIQRLFIFRRSAMEYLWSEQGGREVHELKSCLCSRLGGPQQHEPEPEPELDSVPQLESARVTEPESPPDFCDMRVQVLDSISMKEVAPLKQPVSVFTLSTRYKGRIHNVERTLAEIEDFHKMLHKVYQRVPLRCKKHSARTEPKQVPENQNSLLAKGTPIELCVKPTTVELGAYAMEFSFSRKKRWLVLQDGEVQLYKLQPPTTHGERLRQNSLPELSIDMKLAGNSVGRGLLPDTVNLCCSGAECVTVAFTTGTQEERMRLMSAFMRQIGRTIIDQQLDSSAGAGATSGVTQPTVRQRLVQIYEEYNHTKLREVDAVLAEWAGKEDELISNVEKKYLGAVVSVVEHVVDYLPIGFFGNEDSLDEEQRLRMLDLLQEYFLNFSVWVTMLLLYKHDVLGRPKVEDFLALPTRQKHKDSTFGNANFFVATAVAPLTAHPATVDSAAAEPPIGWLIVGHVVEALKVYHHEDDEGDGDTTATQPCHYLLCRNPTAGGDHGWVAVTKSSAGASEPLKRVPGAHRHGAPL